MRIIPSSAAAGGPIVEPDASLRPSTRQPAPSFSGFVAWRFPQWPGAPTMRRMPVREFPGQTEQRQQWSKR
jgi:hypothetical protein